MTDTQLLLVLAPVALIAYTLGYAIAYFLGEKKLSTLREETTELKTTLKHERTTSLEKQQSLEKDRENLNEAFAALASKALKHNSDEFLKLAEQNLQRFQVSANSELDKKQQSIAELVKPIRDALDKTEKQVREMEKERREAYGSLKQHLELMSRDQAQLQSETRNLVQALRRPEVRGQWGEMTLKRLAELAGMVQHCDFYEQESVSTDKGRLRPDMIIRMPGQRAVVVDAKAPLDAYMSAVEANEDKSKEEFLVRHTKNVRERIRELSAKSYWSQFDDTPDFAVLFIPGDQFLSAALERDPSLLEDAMSQQIILATPSSFVALLRAVAFGWRQEVLADNADKIRSLGTSLYERLSAFSGHLGGIGNSLTKSVEQFNKAVGSFDSRVLPSARRFTEMGISVKKEIKDPEPVELITREINERNNDSTD